jgi:uncharacterized protein YdeI (YjbR/CyaY-like superfamily)
MTPRFFATQQEFGEWLDANHDRATELLVGFYKTGSGKGGLTYKQALDEALCIGWIDGVRKSLGAESYTIRFTPRRAKSIWSQVNIRRVHELIASGAMKPPGLRVFEARDEALTKRYSYEQRAQPLAPEYEAQLRANADAWAHFEREPPWYRRVASFWVMSAKRVETREKRLKTLIERSAKGLRVGPLDYTK